MFSPFGTVAVFYLLGSGGTYIVCMSPPLISAVPIVAEGVPVFKPI